MKRTFVTLFALISLGIVLGLTVILGSVISRELGGQMAELKAKSIRQLESVLGSTITYAGISPSFLNYLEIRDLTIHDPADPARALLTIHRLRIYYSLVDLIVHRDPVGALREIRILNSHFSLDLEKDEATINLLRRLTTAGPGPDALRARITGADVDISLRTGATSLAVSHLFFQIDARPDALAVSLHGDARGALASGFEFSSGVDVRGKIDRAFSWSDLTVRALSFESTLVSLDKQTFQVVWKGTQVQVQKIEDRSPIDLGVTADLERQVVTVSFQTDGLRADRLMRFSNEMQKFNNWLKAPVTAAGHLTYAMASGGISYEVAVSAFFQDQLPVHDISVDSTFEGTERGVFFSPLRVSSPSGSLQFDGSIRYGDFYPEGTLTLVNVEAGTGKRVSADLAIRRGDGRLSVKGKHLMIGEVGFDDFSVSLAPEDGGAAFTIDSSFADAASGHISARGTLLLRRPVRSSLAAANAQEQKLPSLSLSASLRDVPPDRLYHLVMGAGPLTGQEEDIRGMLTRYLVTANLDLTSDLSTLSARSDAVTVTETGDPTTQLHFSTHIDSAHAAVNALTGTIKGRSIAGSFEASFDGNGQVGFSTDFRFLATPFSLRGSYSDAEGLSATGSYGLSINAVPNRDGTWSLQAAANRLPVPLAGNSMSVSFDASGLYSGPGEWVVRAPSFVVYDLPLLESKRNSVGFAARITPHRADLEQIRFNDEYSSLVGSAQASLAVPLDPFDPRFLTKLVAQFNGTLKSASGAEAYAIQGNFRGGSLGASITFEGVPLARMRALSITGTVSGTGTISGPLSDPSLVVQATLKEGRLGTDPLSLDARAAVTPQAIQISSLNLKYLAHSFTDATGTLDMGKGTISLSGRYTGEYFSDTVRLIARLEGQFAPPAPGTAGQSLLDQGLQGRLSMSDITVASRPYPSWAVIFKADKGRLTLDGGPGNSIHGSIDSHLAFAIHLARPLPFVGDAGGRIIGDRIVASVGVQTFDATALNSILKSPPITTQSGTSPVLTWVSGSASGRLSITGPVNDPDFNGELSVLGAVIRSGYCPDDAGPIATKLIFDGKGFHFPEVLANAGATRLRAQASFTIDHWVPLAFDLSVRTDGSTAAHVRVKFGRMIADGHLTGGMRIAGDDTRTNVTGDILVTECRITLGQAPEGKFVSEEPPTFLTLNAQTGKRVEFAWPSENYPVLRTTASPGGSLAITYRGDTGAYTVKGTAGIQGGEIYYFERSFILRKGSITFNEDQASFDPHITARAEVREWDPATAEEIRIYLDADNPLSKFTPRFSSDPPRSENYLMAMIGAPFVARAETQGLGLSAALISSDIVSQAWVLRPLEQRLRDALRLDMVSVRTQVIQNLLVQKIFGTTMNPLDNTSISLGKYLGNDLFLEMLVRLQTQPVPGAPGLSVNTAGSGVGLPPIPSSTLPTAGIGLQPQLQLSMEWATPFFMLDWNFEPQHPETLFLTDNALTFSWRFSY